MERQLEGRVRYDEATDSFIYETRTVDVLDDGDEEIGEWGMCLAAKCYRREGADDGEDSNFIHYSFVKQVIADAWTWNVRIHLA